MGKFVQKLSITDSMNSSHFDFVYLVLQMDAFIYTLLSANNSSRRFVYSVAYYPFLAGMGMEGRYYS